jgi:tRNA wybutosine-synthesizing protein 3
MDFDQFTKAKSYAMQKLQIAHDSGQVDPAILPVLDAINAHSDYFTTSSCAGRIQVFEIPKIGDKKNAHILGKWHHTITQKKLIEAVSSASTGMIWMLAQSPIIHIAAASFEKANILVKQAIRSGFKNSGIKTHGKQLFIEICSTERLDAPIGEDGKLYGSSDFITLLVKISNDIIIKSTGKLDQLLKSV